MSEGLNDSFWMITSVVFITFSFCFLMMCFGLKSQRDDLKKEAIIRGHAEYYQLSTEGDIQWRWKDVAK